MTHRNITIRDKRIAARAKHILKNTDFTQRSLAFAVGITQPTVAQYLNAIIPWNTDFVLDFCATVGCSISDLDPSLAEKIKKLL